MVDIDRNRYDICYLNTLQIIQCDPFSKDFLVCRIYPAFMTFANIIPHTPQSSTYLFLVVLKDFSPFFSV